MLCDDPKGWRRGSGREAQEGGDIGISSVSSVQSLSRVRFFATL